MTTPHPGQSEVIPAGVRRLGYALAVGFSFGVFVVANRLLDWDRIPFLTNDLEQLLPIINATLVASMAINGVWIIYDAPWFRSAGKIVLNVLTMAVLGLTLRVFPLDLASYSFDWEALILVLMVGVLVALAIATVVEMVKLVGRFTNS